MLPPVIIFAYNRPEHLARLLKSLLKNKSKNFNKLYLFCDGPKNEQDKIKILKIKKIISNTKIKFQKKVFRSKNIGLSKNIINGVSDVLKKNTSCIVLEDDLVLSNNCIKFMNYFLKKYKNSKNFGSISAHSYLKNFQINKKFNYYITKRHSSWCWGTWARVWKKMEWNKINYNSHFKSFAELRKFSEGGNDLNLLLWGQYKKYIDSWAIRFNYFCSKNDLISLQPKIGMVKNLGRDFSGTHENFSFRKENNFNFISNLNLKKSSNRILNRFDIDNYIKNSHRRSIRLALKYFIKNKKIL